MLDNIEHSVSMAVNHTNKGVDELRKANEHAKSARKKMCCLIILFGGIAIAILSVVLLSRANND